ncbi:MAG TPA: amidohydrolase family protein [Acidimicrobiales bacterium]|nr:amidohydrolase family protein [Acidimicrobiales bacterium]
MSTKLDFPVFDSDNHLYETEDAFTRYLLEEYQGLIKYVQVNGRTKIAVDNVISDYIPNPTFEVVARPGAHKAYFSGTNTEGKTLRELTGEPIRAIPAFRSAAPRLALLDELGVDASLMFPTLASLLEVRLSDDPELTGIVIHAFNRWMLDEWTFNYRDRIFATPVVNPCIVERGIAELDWCLEQGAKAVLLRPAPVAGFRGTKSPFLPEFDPFWARVQEAGILVTLHASDSGYQRYVNDWNGTSRELHPFKPDAFGQAITNGRAISDTFTSAVCHGMLTRFPGIKLASVENGGSWTIPCVKNLEVIYKKMPQEFAEHPRDVFVRNVYVNPFWEDSIEDLVEFISPEHVLFGSDYPHPEGLDDPVDWANEISSLFPADDVRKIMGANMYGLVGVAAPAA